jgi:hypothetical protein
MNNNEMGEANYTYGEWELSYRICWGNLREIDGLEDLGVDGRIILK